MQLLSFVFVAVITWLSTIIAHAVPGESCLASSPSTWECTVRCYGQKTSGGADWRWLDDHNQSFLVCTALPNDIQNHIDTQCDEMYRVELGSGWTGKGFFNWPASPGSLVACKSVGNRCTKPGVVKSNWSCPATCRGPSGNRSTIFNICAVSESRAFNDGLQFYRTDGPHPLCRRGETLGGSESSEPLNDPPYLLCKSAQKECEC